MLDQNRPLTVNEISNLIAAQDPSVLIDRNQISSMVRNFAASRYCTCLINKDAYPPRYHLLSMRGYTFKIRNDEGLDRNAYPIYAKRPAVVNDRKIQAAEQSRSSELFRYVMSVMGKQHTTSPEQPC